MLEKKLESLPNEIWLPMVGYEKDFHISSLGRVKRLASNHVKVNKSKLGKEFLHNTKVSEKILTPNISRAGYLVTRTQVKGVRMNIVIHREVAKCFLLNCENKPQVNHIDGDKLNNCVINLEWVTVEENNRHFHENSVHDTHGRVAKAFTGSVDAYNYQTGEFVCRLFGNKDMKEKGFDFRLVSAVIKGKRNKHNNCYFIKNDDNILRDFQTTQFSKSSFKSITVFDKNDRYLFTLATYKDILTHNLTPQRVGDCLIGKAKQHKGYIFKLQEKTNNAISTNR